MPSNKPQSVKSAVIALTLAGESNSQIARELEISRPTVQRILDESEISKIVAEGKSRAISFIPLSLDAVEDSLRKKNPKTAISILQGTGILRTGNESVAAAPPNIQVKVVLIGSANAVEHA